MFPTLFGSHINTNLSFVDYWLYLIDSLNSEERGLLAITYWAIWNDRNSMVQWIVGFSSGIKVCLDKFLFPKLFACLIN